MAETPTQYRMSGNPFFTRERPRTRINTKKFFIPDPWGAGTVPQPKTPAQNPKQNQASGSDALVQRNALILNNISNTMKIISEQMVGMNKALQVTSNLIVDSEKFKKKREEEEEKREEFLKNRKLAAKSETALEESALQKALMSPVRSMGNKVKSILGSIQEAIMVMFGGWLSWEFLKYIGAWADDNKKLMTRIQRRITSGVAVAVGILGGLKWGIGKVITTIAGLGIASTNFVGRNMLSKPLGMALSTATGGRFGQALIYGAPFRRLPLFGRKPFIPPSKLSKGNLLFKKGGAARFKAGTGTGIASIFEVFNGNYLEGALGGSAIALSRSPHPKVAAAGMVLKFIFWARQFLNLLPQNDGGVPSNASVGTSNNRDGGSLIGNTGDDGIVDFGILDEAPKGPETKWHHGLPFFMNPTAIAAAFGMDPFKNERLPEKYTYWMKMEPGESGISTTSNVNGDTIKKIDGDDVSKKLGPVEEQPTIAIPIEDDTKNNNQANAGSTGSSGITEPIPVISTRNKNNIYVQFAYSNSNLIGVA